MDLFLGRREEVKGGSEGSKEGGREVLMKARERGRAGKEGRDVADLLVTVTVTSLREMRAFLAASFLSLEPGGAGDRGKTAVCRPAAMASIFFLKSTFLLGAEVKA